jgi:transposase InsO family protein
MTVVSQIASQRTEHGVPHAVSCRALGVSESWFYKWHDRPATPRQQRRVALVGAITESFEASGRTYGSPRVLVDLREAGWKVTKHTVAKTMAAEGLVGRAKKRRRCLTRPDKRAVPFPDLVRRDFSAPAPNVRWCGDVKQIGTGEGPLYLASVEDLFSRRMLGFAMSEHPDARLCRDALHMAAAVRGGDVAGVIFHSDKGSTYTADLFTRACVNLKIRQSMGRVGSALDNAAAESFFSTLEHELLTRHPYATRGEARRAVARWIDEFYNPRRRHSTCAMLSPVAYEHAHAARRAQEAA